MKKFNLTWLRTAGERIHPLFMKYRAVLIVLLAGMLLLASGGWFKDSTQTNNQSQDLSPATDEFELVSFEKQLNAQLGAIAGVGRVSLMLSLEETEESIYAVNTRETRSDTSGRSFESDLTVLSDGSYGESPVTVKSLLPTFRGAVVLCDGADVDTVRYAVTRAVSTLCGIGADKVTVLKMAPTT